MSRPALAAVAVLLLAAAVVAAKRADSPAAYLLLIHESADSTQEQATVRDAVQWREAADAAGIKWAVIDQNEAAKRWPKATEAARQAGLPAVVWITADGRGKAEQQPETILGMVTAVKKHAGGRR